MKKIIWEFDMFIYRLFYWRWRKHLEDRADIRQLFLKYLNACEARHREPAMGIGGCPELKEPEISPSFDICSPVPETDDSYCDSFCCCQIEQKEE
jgi:hypothetical protein